MPNGNDFTDKKRGFRIEGTVSLKNEHELIMKAAARKNMSVSQFVVNACLREARGDQTLDLLAMLVQQMESAICHQVATSDRQDQILKRLDEFAERQHMMLECHRESVSTLKDLVNPVERTNQGVEHGVVVIEKINSCVEDLRTMIEDQKRAVDRIDKG